MLIELTVAVILTVSSTMTQSLSEEIQLPYTSKSDLKVFEPYGAITDTSSKQWEILHSDESWINEDGVVMIGEFHAVALGQNFGEIGDKFIFTLMKEDGTTHELKCIMADAKMDQHTQDGWIALNGHVIEMIVETSMIPEEVKITGNVGCHDEYKGEIIKVEKLKGENHER